MKKCDFCKDIGTDEKAFLAHEMGIGNGNICEYGVYVYRQDGKVYLYRNPQLSDVRAQIREGLTMATCEYLLGYRAALRHLIEAADAPGNQLKKMKITAKKTTEWLKLCHEHAFELAEGEVLDLWQTPEGKLFFKKESR